MDDSVPLNVNAGSFISSVNTHFLFGASCLIAETSLLSTIAMIRPPLFRCFIAFLIVSNVVFRPSLFFPLLHLIMTTSALFTIAYVSNSSGRIFFPPPPIRVISFEYSSMFPSSATSLALEGEYLAIVPSLANGTSAVSPLSSLLHSPILYPIKSGVIHPLKSFPSFDCFHSS